MNVLVLDVLHVKSLKAFGRAEIHDIVKLNGTNPIDKYVVTLELYYNSVVVTNLARTIGSPNLRDNLHVRNSSAKFLACKLLRNFGLPMPVL